MGDHVLRRGRVVVAEVVGRARVGPCDAGGQHLRDVVHVDAAEDLAFLDDAARRALAHLFEGPAPGAVDTRKAEDVQGKPRDRGPGVLGLLPPAAALGRGVAGRILVHPSAAVVAIDAGRRQVSRPVEARRGLRDSPAIEPQDRVAIRIGRGRCDEMRRLAQRPCHRGRVLEQDRLGPRVANRLRPGFVPRRADHAPALRDQQARQRPRRIPMSEGKQCLDHDP